MDQGAAKPGTASQGPGGYCKYRLIGTQSHPFAAPVQGQSGCDRDSRDWEAKIVPLCSFNEKKTADGMRIV